MKDMKMNMSREMAMPDMPKEEYPYGLCIRLDDDSLKKLGLENLPELGAEMKLSAIVVVKGKSMSEHENHKHKSLELQITEMDLKAKDTREKNPEKNLYGEG